jgi:TolR protein
MSFQLNNQNNHRKRPIISDINITPFVDVLLVLLIIFMVAAPMMTSSIEVDLPSGVDNHDEEKDKAIMVSLKKDGSIFVEDEICKINLMGAFLGKATNKNFNHKIYIRADQDLDYGNVMKIVQKINELGFTSVSLATEITQ